MSHGNRHHEVIEYRTAHQMTEVLPMIKGKEKQRREKMPEISVLMPSYNHGGYIAKAIESVLNQTWTDLELVIVDDASTDNSVEVINDYQKQDARIRTYFRETNQGTTANKALDMAKGKYITFCDSDDLCVADRLEKQLAAIREKGNENKVIIADAVNIDASNHVLGSIFLCGPKQENRLRQENKNGDIFNNLFQFFELHFCRQTTFLKRENLAGIRFDAKLPLVKELKFAAELAYYYQYYWVDDVVYKHRIHTNNQSTGWNEDLVCQGHALIAKDFLKLPYANRLSISSREYLYQKILHDALRRKDLQELGRYALEFISFAPSLAPIKDYIAQGRDLSGVELTISGTGGEPMILRGSDILAGLNETSLGLP